MTGLLLLAAAAIQASTGPFDVLQPDVAAPEKSCVVDKSWCLTLVEREDAPIVRIDSSGPERSITLPKLQAEGGFDHSLYSIWPMRIPLGAEGDFLIGVVHEERTMYSGGGAHASTLTLYHVSAASPIRDVLTVPWESGSMIRACFSEKDFRQRRGACHDEYKFSTDLAPKSDSVGGMPILKYRAWAVSYPGAVSRKEDSLAAGKLRRKDLAFVRNEDCTFAREYRFDTATGQYAPDSPLPECDDYTGL